MNNRGTYGDVVSGADCVISLVCPLFPVPSVSHLHKRVAAACPLNTPSAATYITLLHLTPWHYYYYWHNFYYYLHNITTPYTSTTTDITSTTTYITLLHLTLVCTLSSTQSPTVLFTGSGNKRDYFLIYVFLFSLSQYPFNVKK